MKGQTSTGTRLTSGELSLWLLQRLVPDKGVFNVAIRVTWPDQLGWWALREAFAAVVGRHDALRAAFPLDGDEPVKRIDPADDDADLDIDVLAVDSEEDLEAALREYAGRPFALDAGQLVRLGLVTVGRDRSRFCLAAHHLVVDAASLDLLLAEIIANYQSLTDEGVPATLPDPAPPVGTDTGESSLGYWLDRLEGFEPAGMRLPMARDVADPPTFTADQVYRTLSADVTAAVDVLRKRGRGTDAAVLYAAYLVALRAQGAADDTVVGVMVSTRDSPRARDVGYRVTTLPVRMTLDPTETFAAFTARAAIELGTAVEHSDVSFESLLPGLELGDDPLWWRSGLVRQTFNYRLGRTGRADDSLRVRDVNTGYGRFDLELDAGRHDGGVFTRLLYSTEVHDRAFAEALLDRIAAVLLGAAADPDRPIGELDARTAGERAVNDTEVAWPGPRSVPGAIQAALARTPESSAIVDGARTVTYRELAGAATQVAHVLRDNGVGAGDVVAVAGPRGPELAAAVLGTWAVGAGYLPLDADHPVDRLNHQVDDAGCRVLLDGHLLPEQCRAGRISVDVPLVGSVLEEPEPLPDLDPDSLAYLIYTSGSTGRPKGVRLTHGNLANVVAHFSDLLDAGPSTAMLWLTTFAFDISALEVYLPLTRGGRVVVAPDAVRADAAALLGLVERAGVTAVQATPTTWRLLAANPGTALHGRTVLCGGEPLSAALATQFVAAGCRAYNVYGPTETTIWSTVAELTPGELDRPSVGRPLANTRVGVHDDHGRPVPPGAPGELCIAGDGVADGYHDRPELTADKFRDDPLLGRYYRTGDVARLLPDGRIELLGRRDRQIKLRAHRIELGEVEAAIESHPEVRAAAVVLRGDPTADGHLAAYIVADARPGLAEDVWGFGRDRLPAYSLPGQITVVAALPQTPNGKIDTSALAALEPSGAAAPPPSAAGGLVEELVTAWGDVLGLSTVDRDSNFFLSGGTSLVAVRLAATATRVSGAQVTMGMIFRAPTPAALADLLGRS